MRYVRYVAACVAVITILIGVFPAQARLIADRTQISALVKLQAVRGKFKCPSDCPGPNDDAELACAGAGNQKTCVRK